MDKAIKYLGSYQEGYHDGYMEGLNQAIKLHQEQVLSKPIQIVISKEDLINIICKKCSLKNTEQCKPEDMVLYDETTCKSFRL